MPRPEIVLEPKKHTYTVNGVELPSVTKIINATTPKDLSWWGMEVGTAGVCLLAKRGRLPRPLSPSAIVDALKQEQLTTNNAFWRRGESGTRIHKALEDYGLTGKVPDLDDHPPVDHQRVQNLCMWILDNKPEFLEQEVQTASLEHGYCGTFDARIKFHSGEYKDKVCLVDLKTGKHVYPESQFPQLEAYEQAEIEAGMGESDYRLVLHLPADSPATLTPSLDTFSDFLVLMEHYKSILDRRERLKAWKKNRKAQGLGVFV